MRVLLLLAAAALCGCASAPQGLSQLTQPDAPQPDYYKEYRAAVGPGFSQAYNVSVAPGARVVNATLTLSTQTHGLAAPEFVPATAELALGGQSARADPATPQVHVELAQPAPGKHQVWVNATGPSADVAGAGDYGATFLLVVQVAYGRA